MSGYTVFSRQAKLADVAPVSEQDSLARIIYVPLKSTGLVVADTMATRLAALGAEIAQDKTPPFNFHSEKKNISEGKLRDANKWRPTLFGDHASAGVVQVASEGPPQYGVVVRTGAGAVGAQYHEFIKGNPTMTVGDFMNTPDYLVANSFAERNTLRIAALIGGALTVHPGAPISTVMDVEPDLMACKMQDNSAPPLLAQPTVTTRYNMLISAPLPDLTIGQEAGSMVYVQNMALPTDHAAAGSAIVHRDHTKGFALRGPSSAKYAPIFDVRTHATQNDNALYSTQKQNREALKAHIQKIYLTPDGKPATSAATQFWAVSENPEAKYKRSDVFLRPVAMFIQAKPAKQTVY